MNSPKSTALTLLMIGSIFWFVVACLQIANFILFGYYWFSIYWIVDLIAFSMNFVASLLIMIGFIKYRSEQSRIASRASLMMPQQPAAPMRAAATTLCQNCGRPISTEAVFCPFCGWQTRT
jgi:RNA polymerase subunit RPABC4/transcription elongation factor Spt4